jgi:nucleoid-associated protein YgaU
VGPHRRALRLVVVTTTAQSVAVVACAGTVRAALAAAADARGAAGADPARVAATVEALAWAGLALCCAWFGLAVLACARDLARHPSRPLPRTAHGCLRPAFVRSLLVVLVGGCLSGPTPWLVADGGSGWSVLDGLPLPGLPLGDPPHAGRRDLPQRPGPPTVRVRPGDCLWTITATLLGHRAADAEVARAWPVLHRANRHVLGPDPDLVLPGTTLRVPAALSLALPLRAAQDQSRPGAR